jgi:hypothetical protein
MVGGECGGVGRSPGSDYGVGEWWHIVGAKHSARDLLGKPITFARMLRPLCRGGTGDIPKRVGIKEYVFGAEL